VNSPLADGTLLTNTASAVDNDDVDPAVSSAVTQTVTSSPSLSVTKTSTPSEGGTVSPGDTISYSVVVENLASATDRALGVELTDATPPNTSYVTDSAMIDGVDVPGDETAGDPNPFEDGEVLGDMDPGDDFTLTFDVEVNSPLPNGTTITNTATASATNAVDTPDDATHTVASAPGLVVDKTASPAEGGPVAPDDTITYTIALSNDPLATDTATNVELTDPTPANTTYVADSATVDTVQVTGATNPFETGYSLPNMAPGAQHTVTFQVLVDAVVDNGTLIANTATLDSDQGSASNNATHTVQSQSTLTLVKTATPAEGGPVTPGTKITYSMLVSNDAAANEVADQLVLTDPTPAGTAYVGSSAAVDGTSIFGDENPLGSGLDLPDLTPGESVTVTYDVVVNSPQADGTVISNLATLTADNHPDLSDEATHTVDSTPVMKVEVIASPVAGSQVKSGQTIVYTIKVSNDPSANGALTSVSVTEQPPQGTTLQPSSARLDTSPGATSAHATSTQAGGEEAASGAVALTEGLDQTDEEIVNLNNALWWELAHGVPLGNALFSHPNVLDNMLPVDIDQGSGPPGAPLWLFAMSPQQLETLGATNPNVSQVIEAALADYQPSRLCYEYALADYQLDLGLTPTISAHLAEWVEQVGLSQGTEAARAVISSGEAFLRGTLPPAAPDKAASAGAQDATTVSLGNIEPGQSRTVTFSVLVGKSASGQLTNTATVTATNHPTVVATTTHLAPQSSGGGGNGGGGGGSGGDGSGGDGSGTTTSLESTSSGAAGESLAFTGLDLARLLLLALSLLLAGWVLLSRGRVLQRRAVGRHRGYVEPETLFPWDGAWFYPSSRK
jgi:uncharacterized repeat protein (TIGR01451 family)